MVTAVRVVDLNPTWNDFNLQILILSPGVYCVFMYVYKVPHGTGHINSSGVKRKSLYGKMTPLTTFFKKGTTPLTTQS